MFKHGNCADGMYVRNQGSPTAMAWSYFLKSFPKTCEEQFNVCQWGRATPSVSLCPFRLERYPSRRYAHVPPVWPSVCCASGVRHAALGSAVPKLSLASRLPVTLLGRKLDRNSLASRHARNPLSPAQITTSRQIGRGSTLQGRDVRIRGPH